MKLTTDGTDRYDPYRWRWGRNQTLTVWGEYEPMDSWECVRKIRPVVEIGGLPFDAPEMELVVSVRGKRVSGRLRPHRWSARLRYFNQSMLWADLDRSEWSGSCTSVVDARRRADQIPTLDEAIMRLAAFTYSKRRAGRVLRRDEDDWTPFMSDFYHLNSRHYPRGSYVEFTQVGDVWHQSFIETTCYGGYTGSCLPPGHEDEIAHELRTW